MNSPIELTPTIDIADTLDTPLRFNVKIKPDGSGIIKAYTNFWKKGEKLNLQNFQPISIQTSETLQLVLRHFMSLKKIII